MASTKKITYDIFLERCLKHTCCENYDFSSTIYTNIRTSVTVECKLHGKFICKPQSIMSGNGCNLCDHNAGKKVRLTETEYKIVASLLHNDKYDYSLIDSDFHSEKMRVICPMHGVFLARKSAHISPTQLYGCPQCGNTRSIGEEKIIKFLKEHLIEYEPQKTFEWNKSIDGRQPLRYDFYIPTLNILIEFDGKHHFEPTRYGGQTQESALLQTKRTKFYDGIKTANAFLSNIRLIRISYNRINELERILKTELVECINHKSITIYGVEDEIYIN